MNRETLSCVLETNRLPDGTIWTMPILLQSKDQEISLIEKGDCVALTDKQGIVYATLDVTEIYQINLEHVTKKWFGTTSLDHHYKHFLVSKITLSIEFYVLCLAPLSSLRKSLPKFI